MNMRVACLALSWGLCLAVIGCGGSGVQVTGKVVKGGAPYTLAEGEGLNITLTGEAGRAVCTGTVEKDGSFKIQGPNGGRSRRGSTKSATSTTRRPTRKARPPRR